MLTENDALFSALSALGDLLTSRGQSYGCVVAGGTSLAALGVLVRVTGDVDVMAVRDQAGNLVLAPTEFPEFLTTAIQQVAREFNLPVNWMNTQMASGLKAGLPPGYEKRLVWRQFGGLQVGFVARKDLIALKLEAASDDPPHGRTDVHVEDLVSLDATSEELDEAARWVMAVNVDPRRTETIVWVKQYVAERRSR